MPKETNAQQKNEKHWARAFAVFRRVSTEGADHLEEFIAEANLNPTEREILERLLSAQKKHTTVLDEAFQQRQEEMGKALLKNREGEQLGQYLLQKLIGAGGMSAVYLAKRTDTDIQKKVAVKILLFPSICPHVLELFLQEQRLLSRLNHPNIVSMLHGSMAEDGTPFLVMEYIPEARTIDQWIQDRNATPEDIVDSMLPLCDAIAHAHSHLIVHSDIKPGNVLVDSNDTVKLLDFGIASFLRKQQQDRSGVRALSPAYASPEQLAGETVTIASDIYSSGLLLTHLLTGEAPAVANRTDADSKTAAEPKRQALARQLQQHRVDPELQSIIFKATEEKPQDRYESIQQMRQDLHRWLKKKPVTAHPAGLIYQLKKFVQRQTALAVSLALLISAILAGFFLLAMENRQTQREAEKAQAVTRFMLDAFAITDPDTAKGVPFSARDILAHAKQQLSQQSLTDPAVHNAMLAAIATAENRLGNYQDSLATLTPVLKTSPVPADALSTAVQDLLQLGELGRARQWLERDGPTVLDPAEYAYLQSMLANAEDRFDEAINWLSQAEKTVATETTVPSDLALRLKKLRGDILFNQGKTRESLAIYLPALQQARKQLGEQHSLSYGLQQRIAQAYNDLGEFDTALPILTGLYDSQIKHFGKQHPVLIGTLLQLAGNGQYRQQYVEAEGYARQAVQLAESTLGPDSLLAGRSRNMLGILAFRQGRIKQAIEQLLQASAIYHEKLGDSHRETGEIDTTLANLMIAAGDAAKAQQLIEPVVAFQSEKLGAGHKATIYSRLTLLKALNKQQKYPQAQTLAEKLLPTASRALGESHPMITAIRKALADARKGNGDPAGAIALYQQVIASPFMQQQPQQLPALLNLLAESQWQAGQHDLARQHFKQARQKAEALFGQNHPMTGQIIAQQQRWLAPVAGSQSQSEKKLVHPQ
jgi:serine/threonine-protein kinase